MFIIESYQDDKTGSTFVGYLSNFNKNGGMAFTQDLNSAHRFAKKEDCIVQELDRWDNGNGGKGYYRIKDVSPEKEHNIPGISNKTLNLILRKKTLWTEIKSLEQEYGRLGKQIHQIEQDRKDISFKVQKKIDESQEIAEKLDEMEYEGLKKREEKEQLPDGQARGRDLIFISILKRDGSGTGDVSKEDMSDLDETIFTINCLSISEKTYIANEFNSYVVKLKKDNE